MTTDLLQSINLLYDNSRDFVFFMRKNGQEYEYVYVNKSAQEMLGQDSIGRTLSEITESDAARFIKDNYNQAVSKNEQHEFEDYSYFKLSVHKHETTVTPVIIDGQTYVLAVTKEIEFDRDLQDNYLFMRSIFFKTFLSTILIKKDATIVEANPTFTTSLNLKLNDILGKKFYELPIFTEQTVLQIQTYINSAKNGDHFSKQMITFVDSHKKEHYYMTTFSPVLREDEVVAIFIIFQDVTDYILQQRELKLTTHGLETFKRAINYAAEVTITNLKGEIIDVNDKFLERTGYTREELIGKTHNIVNSNYHPREFFKNLWDTITEGKIWRGEVRNQTKNGETYWVETTIIPLTNEEDVVYQYITIHFNVSDKKQLMIELRNIERTFRLITENTNDFIVVLNNEGKVVYSSPSYIRKLGYNEEEIKNISYKQLIHEDSLPIWNALLTSTEGFEKDGHIELKLETKEGQMIWTEGNYSLVYDHLRNVPSQIIMVSREITERKEREDSLLFLAYHDSLTQLPNRRYLQREFPQFVERANNAFESFAVLYLDGDNFKAVNDQFGHEVGDEFLNHFGKVLLKSLRKNDLVIRIGGDEFVIIVPNLNRDVEKLKQAIDTVIKKIRDNLAIGWFIQGVHFSPTTTIGVSIYPFDGITMDELIDCADRALYQAKQISKNSEIIPYFNYMNNS